LIPQADRRIKKHPVPELEANSVEYRQILDDMVRNSGLLIPDPNWLMTEDTSQTAESYDPARALDFALSHSAFAKISRMPELMKAWIGEFKRPTRARISEYYRFLQHCDVLDLWPANMEGPTDAVPIFRQDLGSLLDLNLIYTSSASSQGEVTRILEVGGGYGRLAEAAFNVFGNSIQYVIVDAVPASLHYAKKYLSCACPDARIGSYYDADNNFDPSRHDIAIVPAWHFEEVNTQRYDICVNIESMQEMNQYHVDYYLNLFDSMIVDGGTVYVSNSHDYYFRGSFNYPAKWQRLFCSNTPRSWTRDHPTEIFRKTGQDCSLPNRLWGALHKYRVSLESDPQWTVERYGVRGLGFSLLQAIASRSRHYARRLANKCGLK
jgi:hypothetical protein